MSGDTPQTRTLYRALENCGGKRALAEALGVSVEVLCRWLAGEDVPPVQSYLAALDLVAMGERARRTQTGG